MDDDADDIRWMTYAELGVARGISTASATRLVFRRRWRRQVGNKGVVKVAVPAAEAKPQKDADSDDGDDIRGDVRDDIGDDDRGDVRGSVTHDVRVNFPQFVSLLSASLAVIRDHLERERARGDQTAAQLAAVEARAVAAELRADRAETRAAAAEVRAAQVEAVAAADQAADRARRTRGTVRRLLAALRTE
jgi:hypothetical protein